MTEMTARQILDAIDRALDEAARLAAERHERTPPPEPLVRPAKPMEQMTDREILDAIDRGLEEAARIAKAKADSGYVESPLRSL